MLARRVVLALLLLAPARPALAEDPPTPPPPAPLEDRAKILAVELRRGPAKDLLPYLEADASPRLRLQAIRALGRIGDRAGAPELLAKLLGGGDQDRVAVLQAAALSAAKSLEGPVAGHVDSKDVATAVAALEALGWIGGDTAATTCAQALHHPDPLVVAAAVEALGRCRKEAYLERCARFAHHADPGVRRAAWFACWRLAGARKEAARAGGAAWRGEVALAQWLASSAEPHHDDQTALDVLRVLAILAPQDEPGSGVVVQYGDRPDPRVGQELLARWLAFGGRMSDMLWAHLRPHRDAKTREAAIEALAASPREATSAQALLICLGEEPDPRVREAMAVALAKLGDEAAANGILARTDRPADLTLRRMTELRVLAASKRPEAVGEMVALAQGEKQPPAVVLEGLSLLEEKKGPEAAALVAWALEHDDAFVRAAAIGLVGKQGLLDLLPQVERLVEKAARGHAERDVRQAAVECYAELAKLDAAEGEVAERLKAAVRTAAFHDEAFTARAAARDAMKALGMEDAPKEDPLQPNDWQGLPRPKEPILGVDLTKGTGLLTEAEILRLADALAEQKPEFVVQSDVGAFRLAIDPSEAPVHAVSFLLCVASGVYDGTPWHRVVPSFVIQGGDPHGTGNGDAGWSLPDEIGRARFVRGALGMPKGAIRDTGGCQLFVMHSDYRPLDGRYTCYGKVVDGMDTVDKIRVGDRIQGVKMVLK
jgi:cyclophilin family peptidyl-prolyl cis-trans isomerase/HEAT repeat protein